MWGCLRDP
jgi:hypothetical protein